MKKTLRLAAIFGLALTCGTVAWAGTEKLSTELKPENRTAGRSAQNAEANVEVIVQYKVVPTEAHHQRVAALGGTLRNRMDHIKGAHYTLPKSALATLANDPDVAYISPNRSLKAMFDQITNGTVGSSTANNQMQTGSNVGVAIIDSGVTSLNDFQGGLLDLFSRIVYQQSFVIGDSVVADEFGHGTHVA